tara:strand:- start:29 stop:211 length:183 start_codon:yes stop_codon:yes gene_type:complete
MSSKPKPPKLVRQTANKETYIETHGLASYLRNFNHTGRILKINKKKNLAKMGKTLIRDLY